MLWRQYPYSFAGRLAAICFLVAGLIVGWLLSLHSPNGPPPVAGALVWGVLAGGIAYMAYAAEARHPRPASVWQASAADGVVAGIITGILGSLLWVFALAHAGNPSARGPSTSEVLGAGGIGAVGGAVAGAILGAGLFMVARERLRREPPRRAKKRSRKRSPR